MSSPEGWAWVALVQATWPCQSLSAKGSSRLKSTASLIPHAHPTLSSPMAASRVLRERSGLGFALVSPVQLAHVQASVHRSECSVSLFYVHREPQAC